MSIREKLTPAQRATPLRHTIDPGFVHHSKIQTILGPQGMAIIDNAIRDLPDLPDWQKRVRIDQIYTQVFLIFCNKISIRPLRDVLASQTGQLFCSTEKVLPCDNFYETDRAISVWEAPHDFHKRIEFHYSTQKVVADTLRSRLSQGTLVSIVGQQYNFTDEAIIFEPIIMGFPWLLSDNQNVDFDIMWWGSSFFENFLEDFDEFSKVSEIPLPDSPEPMKDISETAFKSCLASILGDKAPKDWGGEASDYFSAHLSLQGRHVSGAFLLKGPHQFMPMTLNHLGKNNDQIVRLSHEPADVLFVQHCHDILQPVRETLRAFSVQPSNPRRYCLIDGRESLRLLYSYNLYDKAIEITKKEKKG